MNDKSRPFDPNQDDATTILIATVTDASSARLAASRTWKNSNEAEDSWAYRELRSVMRSNRVAGF